jgi:hypothetical protein
MTDKRGENPAGESAIIQANGPEAQESRPADSGGALVAGATVVELPRGKKAKVKRLPGRQPKHGGYSGFDMMAVKKEKDAEIRAVLYEAKVQLGIQDSLAIDTLARTLAKVEMLDRWFAACGLIGTVTIEKTGVKVQQVEPAMKIWLAAVNSAARLFDQLGLTPQSRARLGIMPTKARQDLAAGMAEERDKAGG